ncbi:cell cycle control protein cwf22 [Danaus plexippus plexippus]|uniref:Cell cycle control protein cwf22 n=1 Tax=Danaus plexippus plexippus TaxID=278856 RepID=A0A212EGV0_DANPL|nr:cell cycle control protein cwf22 [Danaus plexippus plexippus]
MDRSKENKRRHDRYNENEEYRDNRSRKRRSRSRSRNNDRSKDSRRKRNHSRSRSPAVGDRKDRRRNDAPKDVPNKTVVPSAPKKAKETDMLNTRTGGAYIPPARLRMMQAQITDKSSVAYQRLAWEALKKSVHGHINKINVGNIGIIIKQLLKENIVRGRGLLCRSVIQAQAASPTFTNVYAALVAAVNSRFPNIGELLLKRLVIQFKRGFKRNDKSTCISSASFIAHLVNQKVAHEILALELLTLLVETPTDDSVEVAIAFLKECGQKLTEVSSKGVNAIFEMLRNILHEGKLDKRVQYMIEVVFQVWKDGFKDHPAVIEELELVPEEEQFTHLLMLDDATDAQDILNVFKFDDKYEENEQKYKALCGEILGSDAESGEDDGSEESGSEESDEEDEKQKEVTIIDNTETNLVALRRTIYLTINSSLDFEECAHKLMKMQLKPGQEVELCHMFLDCCAEQRTYEKFYGLLAQRFCNINRIYIGPFEEIFKDSYATAHRLDTNRLRNVSKFFAHLLFTDSISWEALECVKLNEEDTTSSSRIYIKILFQELAEYMGLKKLNDRLKDPTLQQAFSGIFPRDNPKNTRFSINFFTSIGLGGLTDELREHLKQMPKNVPPPITEINIDSESSSDSSSSSSSSDSSSSSSSDSSSSDSEAGNSKKEKKSKKKTKNKTSKTPEPEEQPKNKESDKTERWGHDGFYDTYGKDARRNEVSSGRNGREKGENTRSRRDLQNGEERHRNNDRRNERAEAVRNRGREEHRDLAKERVGDRDKKDKGNRDRDANNRYDDNENDVSKRRHARDSRKDRDDTRSKRNGKETEEHRQRDDREKENGKKDRKRYDRDDEREARKKKDEQDKENRTRDRDGEASKRHDREDDINKNSEGNEGRQKDRRNRRGDDDGDRRKREKEARRDKDRNTPDTTSATRREVDEYKTKDDKSTEDVNCLGSRYWDTFDVQSKNDTSKEDDSFEARTPEKNEKYYERRRER